VNAKFTIAVLILGALLVMVVAQRMPVDEPVPVAVTRSADSELDALRLQLSRLELQHQATLRRLSELEQFFAATELGLVQSSSEELESMEPAAPEETEAIPPPQPDTREQNLLRIEASGLTVEEFKAMEQRAYAVYFADFEEQWSQRRQRYLQDDHTPSAADRLRSELGDDSYDRYLFARGESNRARVREVVTGSAADQAGLNNGDIVLSYGNERVFSFRDLRRLSYDGPPGESVILEVRRSDGNVSQLVMPRGPLGLSGSGWSEAP
jgi:membrane-associated protease RseP (regulator of RpoE activity)